MSFVQSERSALCDLFDEVGPDAPTLCEGWSTHDLVVHLWIRETDPIGATGIVAKPLAGLLERRTEEVRQRWSYAEVVDRVRRGPPRFSVFAIPGLDAEANTTEFFVHHEDVRRAGTDPRPPRELEESVEDWMWRRLKLLARGYYRRAPVGVVLERVAGAGADRETDRETETIRAAAGAEIVTLVGRPSELTLFAHGRTSVADLEVVGEPDSVTALTGTDLSV